MLEFRNANDALLHVAEYEGLLNQPLLLMFHKPRERILFNAAVKQNPFYNLYRALWMLAGRNDVTSLAYYNPEIVNKSDEGRTLNAAYGYRWRHAEGPQYVERTFQDINGTNNVFNNEYDQLNLIVNHLKTKSNSRRAVLQMWNVEDDLLKIGTESAPYSEYQDPNCPSCDCADWGMMGCLSTCKREVYVKQQRELASRNSGSKDISSNLSVMFSLREIEQPVGGQPKMAGHHVHFTRDLDMTVTARESHLLEMLTADFVAFTILQEYMAARLGVEVGYYYHYTNCLYCPKEEWEPEKWAEYGASNYESDKPRYRSGMFDTTTEKNKLVRTGKPLPEILVPLCASNEELEVFDKELPSFVEAWGKDEEASCRLTWECGFFGEVAQPLFRACRHRNDQGAAAWLSRAKGDDWRIAAQQYLQRDNVNDAV